MAGIKLKVDGLADMASAGIAVSIGEQDLETAAFQTQVPSQNIRALKDNNIVPIGKSTQYFLRALNTPGHTAGSMCFRVESKSASEKGILITGDTLFINSCWGSKHCGGSRIWRTPCTLFFRSRKFVRNQFRFLPLGLSVSISTV
jgi:glyoxylase-like metal-dependent hydrolase (beta-lactamase superfamily II)